MPRSDFNLELALELELFFGGWGRGRTYGTLGRRIGAVWGVGAGETAAAGAGGVAGAVAAAF